ncbi:MAG: (Fe-S)-binding protein [Pirellulales bacterium]
MPNGMLEPISRVLLADQVRSVAREVFGNIPDRGQTLFYIVALAALSLLAIGIGRRARLWRLGRKRGRRFDLRTVARQAVVDVLWQPRVRGRRKAGRAHAALFGGFVVLLLGTTLLGMEHVLARLLGRSAGDPVFHKGLYYAIFEVVMDVAGVALLLGCVVFADRRWRGGRRIGRAWHDWLVLGLFLAIGGTGFVVEGLRILHAPTSWPGLSPIGYATSALLQLLGVGTDAAGPSHQVLWWAHAVLALGLIALFPYVRLLHALAGAVNLAVRDGRLGRCTFVSVDDVEQTGRYGAGRADDLSRQQLLALDACVSCGRCDTQCPAWEAGKRLSPKTIVQGVRGHVNRVGPQLLDRCHQATDGDAAASSTPWVPRVLRPLLSHCGLPRGADRSLPLPTTLDEKAVTADALWSCTTCSACTDVCPLGVDPAGLIIDLRRYMIGEGRLRGPPAASLQKMQRSGNPWGLPSQDRLAWADGLEVPTVQEVRDFELLYWVGCAAAYDRRVGKVARSVVRLLTAAKVRFAVLGAEERCTGESARRMGDEFLFQELAAANIGTFDRYGVKTIVTHCPHCLNTFRNDYPQMGGHYRVLHHTELLAQLIESGRLPLPADRQAPSSATDGITFHDPCYLARVHGVTRSPRAVLEATMAAGPEGRIMEMRRSGRQTSCCGSGGGRMWFDDEADRRIGKGRAVEAAETGAGTLGVACPFCLITMQDHVRTAGKELEVRDVAEILVDALDGRGPVR